MIAVKAFQSSVLFFTGQQWFAACSLQPIFTGQYY